MASPPPLPNSALFQQPFINYDAPLEAEEPTRILNRAGVPAHRAAPSEAEQARRRLFNAQGIDPNLLDDGNSDRDREERQRFDDMPLDPVLLELIDMKGRLQAVEQESRSIGERIEMIAARFAGRRSALRSAEEISSEHLEELNEPEEEEVDPRARWFDPMPEIPPRQKRDFSHLKDISAFAEPDPEMDQLNEIALDRFRPVAIPTNHGRRPPSSSPPPLPSQRVA